MWAEKCQNSKIKKYFFSTLESKDSKPKRRLKLGKASAASESVKNKNSPSPRRRKRRRSSQSKSKSKAKAKAKTSESQVLDTFDVFVDDGDGEEGVLLHYSPGAEQPQVVNSTPSVQRPAMQTGIDTDVIEIIDVDTIDSDAALAQRLQYEEQLEQRKREKADELMILRLLEQEQEEEQRSLRRQQDYMAEQLTLTRGRGGMRMRGGRRGRRQYDHHRHHHHYEHGYGYGHIYSFGYEHEYGRGNPGLARLSMMDREFNEDDYEMLCQLDEENKVDKGVDTGILRALPTSKYSPDDNEHDQPDSRSCSICLSEYATDEEIRRLPCLHVFHVRCIDQWLKSSSTCPICKWDCSNS